MLSKVFQYCTGQDPTAPLSGLSWGSRSHSFHPARASAERGPRSAAPAPMSVLVGAYVKVSCCEKTKSLLLPTEPKGTQWRNCGSIHTVSGLFKGKNVSAAV